MPVVHKPALSSLVSPRSVDEFFEGYWPDKSKYFVAAGDPARLPEFLHSKELSSFDALARANKGATAFTNGPKSSCMMPTDSRSAEQLFRMGLTVYFDDITSSVPGAVAFVRQLETDLGINEGSARVTAWASPCENGAACHYDANDIISIQLLGTKRFQLAPVRELTHPYGKQYTPGASRPLGDTYPQMTNGFPNWHNAEFETVDMKPGSVLFFPRGTWHRTHASADSLAISIVIEPPSAADCIVEQLRLVMLQDPRWRRPLYGAWGNGREREAALDHAAGLLKEIPKIASVISPEDVTLSTLSEEKRLASIDHNSRFQKVPNVRIFPEASSEPENSPLQWMHITIRDEHSVEHRLASIEIPRQYMEAFKWLAEQETPFDVHTLECQFPAIPFDEHKHLLEICAKGGLLKLLWFPSIEGNSTQ